MSTLPIVPVPVPAVPGQVVAKFPDAGGVIALLANFTAPPKKPIVKPLRRRQGEGAGRQRLGREGRRRHRRSTRSPRPGSKSAGPAEDADRSDYKTQVRYAPGKFTEGYTVAVAVGTAEPRRGRVGEEHARR